MSSREPMWASVQVLVVITVILASIFFVAEYSAQPEEYNYGRSLLWAFTQYIGDPGGFAGPGPVTITGRVLACLLGIVGILIFAVPAGIVGSGFQSAIEDEIRKKHLEKVGNRLIKAFVREQNKETKYRYVPRYIAIATLQAKKNMTEKDVVDAVEYNPGFRLRNLATAELMGVHAVDRLVVEMFPLNTNYGCCIDRHSNITIAVPSAVNEASIGNVAYNIALIGGFNYISKEIEPFDDEKCSFYTVNDENAPQLRKEFFDDLKKLSSGSNNWTIFLIISDKPFDAQIHFITHSTVKTGRTSTVIDQEKFQNFYNLLSQDLADKYFDLKCELNSDYRPVGPSNVGIRIGGGMTTNAITIRISSAFVTWDHRFMPFCKKMAEVINATIGNPNYIIPEIKLKEKGSGYIDCLYSPKV